jgi:predicted DNA-binding transcriptional regulator AlpA
MQDKDNIDELADRLVSQEERRALTLLSDSQAWRKEQIGEFPRRIKLSRGQGGRVAWSLREITAWIEERKAARPNNTTDAETEPQARPDG